MIFPVSQGTLFEESHVQPCDFRVFLENSRQVADLAIILAKSDHIRPVSQN